MPVLKSQDEKFHFHMIYATRDPKGVEEFKKAERDVVPLMHEARAEAQHRRSFEETGQFSLLQPSDMYQENRYTRYRQANLLLAKGAVETMLMEAQQEIAFDHLWAEWMQFACVQDDDLQQWMQSQVRTGKLVVTNVSPLARKFSRKKGVTVSKVK